MALIQNEDNKCPTTKQVNDALKSMGGGVQTLVLTTQDLVNPDRSSIEVNSADAAVMEIVKSNMIDMVPFQLLYYGVSSKVITCSNVTIIGAPLYNRFALHVNAGQGGLQQFGLSKNSNQKWIASPLSNS